MALGAVNGGILLLSRGIAHVYKSQAEVVVCATLGQTGGSPLETSASVPVGVSLYARYSIAARAFY